MDIEANSRIYLDNNATTRCDWRVVTEMLPYFSELYGNPATGLHQQGRRAAQAVEIARERVAALIGSQSKEVIFTSGASESNNLAILGVARHCGPSTRSRIVTSAVEHKAVLLPCQHLEQLGFEVVVLPVDGLGRVSLESAADVIDDNTLLVSIQAANNEIGTIQPIQKLAPLARQAGALLHCDAAQAAGKIAVDVDDWGVDLLSISAHKFYGPKGVGALYVRDGPGVLPLEPLTFGGGQERDLRPGTLNVPGIVGLGEACRIAVDELPADTQRIGPLRDRLEAYLQSQIKGLLVNGDVLNRLPNTSSLVFPGVEADALLLNLPDVMLGVGSACHYGAPEPSHVLQAIGLGRQAAYSTVRVSLGRFTTAEDIDRAGHAIVDAYHSLSM